MRASRAIVVALCVAAAWSPPVSLSKVPDTLALFQFDEGSGNSAADASGTGHDAIVVGMNVATMWTPGRAGNALDFRMESAQYVVGNYVAPYTPISVGSAWTFQAFTRFPLDSTGSNYLASTRQPNGNVAHVTVWHDVLGVQVSQWAWASSGYALANVTPGWHLVSAVGLDGKTRFYIDAAEVGVAEAQVTDPIDFIGGFAMRNWNWGAPIDSVRVMNVARNAADIATDVEGFPAPPESPQPSSFALDGVPLAAGASTARGFVVKATLNGYTLEHALKVELKATGTPFDGAGAMASASVSDGSIATVTLDDLPPGAYHWRAWTSDIHGDSVPSAETDIVITNSAPVAGSARRLGATSELPDRDPVIFEADGSDPDGDAVHLEVEARPAGSAFTGVATATGTAVPSGSISTCRLALSQGRYAWQWRIADAKGAGSPWIAAGTAPFTVAREGSAGQACGASAGSVAALLAAMLLLALPLRRP